MTITKVDSYRRAAAGGGSTITDDYDTADSDTLGPDLTWNEYYDGVAGDVNWEIVSNTATLTRDGGEDFGWALTDASSLTDDVYVESLSVSARMAGGNAFTSAGVCARMNTDVDGYGCYIGEQDREVYLVRWDANTATILDQVDIGSPNAVDTYDIRLECSGTSISGEITDGTSTWNVSATDSTYTTGDVGIYGKCGATAASSDWPAFPAFEAGDL